MKLIHIIAGLVWGILVQLSIAEMQLEVTSLFKEGAVLQQEQENPVWGTAKPGARIVVQFAGKEVAENADKDGRWLVRLPNLPASAESRTMRISAGDELIELHNILVGEVWLCSGQSNMAMAVRQTRNAEAEIASGDLPNVRVFTVERRASETPVRDCTGMWEISSPDTAGKFSAIAWYFGREIHRETNVPVGLIVSAWSGSAIEAWTSHEVQAELPELEPLFKTWEERIAAVSPEEAAAASEAYERDLEAWRNSNVAAQKPRRPIDPRFHHHRPAVLFNGMIAPLIPYGIRGALWYQGETNGLTPESAALYRLQLPMLVNDWRSRWGQGDFPMAWVQLPFTNAVKPDWPTIREAMRLTQAELPNTGMAVALDLGEERLLHPKNKQAYAHRLALWARAEVYGQDIAGLSPLPAGFRVDGDAVVVDFENADGLSAKDGGQVTGFELRAANTAWQPAKAVIDGGSVRIQNDALNAPVAVRYAWANYPDANLFNGAGLPASPFQLGAVAAQLAPAAAKKSLTPPPTHPPLEHAEIATLLEGSERLEIFLLMGQSNMKGRGVMPRKPLRDPRIVMMHKKNDEWFLARHPLHLTGDPATFAGHDNAGVGPGLSFAETLLRHRPNDRVALIPCAVGGTRIERWKRGAPLYEDALRRAKLALEAGPEGKTRIAGALWLQGEADSTPERVPNYAAALDQLIEDLRTDLEIDDLPFLVSTIAELKADVEQRKAINEILVDLPNRVSNTAAVDARDLTGHIGDLVHLDTPTQNEIGRRFARRYLQLPKDR